MVRCTRDTAIAMPRGTKPWQGAGEGHGHDDAHEDKAMVKCTRDTAIAMPRGMKP